MYRLTKGLKAAHDTQKDFHCSTLLCPFRVRFTVLVYDSVYELFVPIIESPALHLVLLTGVIRLLN